MLISKHTTSTRLVSRVDLLFLIAEDRRNRILNKQMSKENVRLQIRTILLSFRRRHSRVFVQIITQTQVTHTHTEMHIHLCPLLILLIMQLNPTRLSVYEAQGRMIEYLFLSFNEPFACSSRKSFVFQINCPIFLFLSVSFFLVRPYA